MAPEVILGDADVDRRADVYALGCVAYFLLTGQLVFEAETPMKMFFSMSSAQPVPPSQRTECRFRGSSTRSCSPAWRRTRTSDLRTLRRCSAWRCSCTTCEGWCRDSARAWWTTHVPELCGPLTLERYRRGAGLAGCLRRPVTPWSVFRFRFQASGFSYEFSGELSSSRPFRCLALALALCASLQPTSAQTLHDETHPRSSAAVTLLQINDVYSTVPVDGVGGLARVAALKRDLANAGRTPLLLIAGDFLSSSVASTVFKGAQMIDALNATGLDVATLGNHEFDFGLDILRQRMAEARWQWVVSNVIDHQTGLRFGGAAPYLIRTVGGLRIGIIGLCLTTEGMPK